MRIIKYFPFPICLINYHDSVFGDWRAGSHILHSCQLILFVIITMVALAYPREERSQELKRVERLKDSEEVPVHLFTDVSEPLPCARKMCPVQGLIHLAQAALSLHSRTGFPIW